MNIEERFFTKLLINPETQCWEWQAAKNSGGYGTFWNGERNVYAHRWSYSYYRGEIPYGLEVDHLCRIRFCVNPNHLEIVSHAENTRRSNVGLFWENKTHCPQGHPYDDGNTYHYNGRRQCRKCRENRKRKNNAR